MQIFDLYGSVRLEGGNEMLGFLDELGEFLMSASKTSMDFEQQLANTAAVSNMTEKEMDRLRQQALKLGKDTQFSALEVAKGQEEMARSGRTVTEIEEQMADVLNLAAAENMEVASATEILVNVMSMFQREGLSSAQVVDILSGAASSSTIEVEDLKESLKYVGPIAATLDIPLKDLSATLALLGNNGIKGSSAGTGLRQMLTRLQPQSKKAKATMDELNITTKDGGNIFYDAQGKVKPLGDIFQILRDKMAGLTDKERQQKLKDMFGMIASPTVNTILNQDAEAFDNFMESIDKSDVAEKARIRMDTFAGSIEFLRGSIETFLIRVGDAINPFLRVVVDAISRIMDYVLELPDSVIAGFTVFIGLISLIAPVIAGITTLTIVIGFLISAVSTIATVVGMITGPMIAWAAGIAAVAVIVPTLVAALVGLILSSENVRSAISEKFNAIKEKIGSVVNWLKQHFDDLKQAFKGLVEGFQTGDFSTLKEALMNMVPPEAKAKVDEIIEKITSFRDKLIEIREKIIAFGQGVIEFITPIANMFIETFANLDFTPVIDAFNNVKAAVQPLIPILQGVAAVIGGVLAVAWGILIGLINGVISALPNLLGVVTSVFGVIVSILSIALNTIVALFTGNWDAVWQSCINLWENIKGVFANAGMFIWNLVSGFVDGVVTFFTSLYNTLVGNSIIPDMINAIIKWFQGLPGKVLAFIASLVSQAVAKFNDLKAKVVSVVTSLVSKAVSVFNTIKSKIGSIIDSLKSSAQSKFNSIKSALSTIVENIKSTLSSKFESAKAKVLSIIDTLKSGISSKFEAMKGFIQPLIDKFNSIKTAVQGVIDKVSNLKFPSMPDWVPGFAEGVRGFGGGWAIVGERGPELLELPRGTNVYNDRDTARILDRQTSSAVKVSAGNEYNISVNVDAKDLEGINSVKDFIKMLKIEKVTRVKGGVM